jgi:hypothetical protein
MGVTKSCLARLSGKKSRLIGSGSGAEAVISNA